MSPNRPTSVPAQTGTSVRSGLKQPTSMSKHNFVNQTSSTSNIKQVTTNARNSVNAVNELVNGF